MKKIFIAIVAMVLLSGAAWGQTTLKKCLEMEAQGMVINCENTPWPDSRYRLEKNEKGGYMTSNHYTKECPENDSRYRLEKNDITGECRVMEKQKICRFESWSAGYKWVEIVDDQTYDCPNWSNCPLSLCKRWPEERLIKYLERLRAKEQAEKAWRPIR